MLLSVDESKIELWQNNEGLEHVEEIRSNQISLDDESTTNVENLVFEESQNGSNADQVTILELKNMIENLRNENARLKSEKAESTAEINRYRTQYGALEGRTMRRRATMTVSNG